MSNGIISLFASIGAAAWIYSRFSRSTGNNVKTALTATLASALVIFIFMLLLLNTIIPRGK